MTRFSKFLALVIFFSGATTTTTAKAAFMFSEAWATTGSQATVDGQAFNDYSEWSFSEETPTNANVRVDSAGILTLAKGGNAITIGGVVTPSSIGVSSPFDVSSFPLALTVEAARGFNPAGSTTSSNVGAFIGNVAFVFHPGSAGGFHRIEKVASDLTTDGPFIMGNTNMGFSPGIDGAAANTGFSEIAITILEKDIDEYTFDYSITDLVDGDVYVNSIDILKADVGTLDRAGVRFAGSAASADGLLQNFTLSQVTVPEPSTLCLTALGLLSLACVGWRRRRRA